MLGNAPLCTHSLCSLPESTAPTRRRRLGPGDGPYYAPPTWPAPSSEGDARKKRRRREEEELLALLL